MVGRESTEITAARAEAIEAEKEAAAEAEKQHAAYVDTLAKGSESWGGLNVALSKAQDAHKQIAQGMAEATESGKGSWEDFYDGTSVSIGQYLTQLQGMVDAQNGWETNMLVLSGRVSQGLIDHLTAMGREGAPLVAELVNATDAELAEMERLFRESGSEASAGFAEALAKGAPVWAALGAKMGSGVVDEAAAEVAAGKTTLQQIIDRYDLQATIDANADPAIRAAEAALARISRMSATVQVRAHHVNGLDAPVATGGYMADVAAAYGLAGGGMARRFPNGGEVFGPGTTTSDDVPARLSRREFVQRAAAVDYYGTSLMYALNAKAIPREIFRPLGFAGGGTPAHTYQPQRVMTSSAGLLAAGPSHTTHVTLGPGAIQVHGLTGAQAAEDFALQLAGKLAQMGA